MIMRSWALVVSRFKKMKAVATGNRLLLATDGYLVAWLWIASTENGLLNMKWGY